MEHADNNLPQFEDPDQAHGKQRALSQSLIALIGPALDLGESDTVHVLVWLAFAHERKAQELYVQRQKQESLTKEKR